MAVLALVRRTHFSAEGVHHELQSVADAEHGQAQLEDARVGGGRVFVVDRPRGSREHDADGRVAFDLVELGRAGEDDGKNILFTNAARDELRVLRAKVEDDDGLVK